MLYGVIINGINTLDEYGLLLCADLKISEPKLKENRIDIPGGDGSLNMSYAPQGIAVYYDREITFTLFKSMGEEERDELVTTLRNAWHGLEVDLILPNDTRHYWHGVISFGDISDYNAGKIPVKMTAEPYKHRIQETAIYVNPGNNKNLYPYYDSFEDVSNDEVSYSNSPNLSISVITTTVPKQGTKVLRCITNTDVSNSYMYLGAASKNYGQVCLPPGKYVASFYVIRQSGEETLSMRTIVYGRRVRSPVWADSSLYKGYNGVVTSIPTSLAWPTRVEIPFTVVSDYPYVCIRLQFLTPSSTYYIDCMQIERINEGQSASEWVPHSETDGTSVVTLQNSDREVVAPSVSATASANLAWSGYSVSISESASIKIPQLVLERGRVSVSVQSAGLVAFIYREGSL